MFQYKAATDSGDVVQGEMEAASQDAVIRSLQSRGQIPIRTEEIGASERDDVPWLAVLGRRRAGRREIDAFTGELAILLQAGVSLETALDMLAGIAEPAPFRAALGGIAAQVRAGTPLSAALAECPQPFSRFYRGVIAAGEESGALGAALSRLAEFRRRSRELRDTVLSAFLYPLVLLAVGGLSIVVILVTVIPRIAQMFAASGESLPWTLQVLAAAGELLRNDWWVMLLAIAAACLWMRWQYARDNGRLRWDRRLLHLPLIGPLVARLEAARFTRTLGGLLADAVPLPDAISITSEALVNRVVADGVKAVAERVRGGEGVARSLAEARIFPPLAGHLIQVGEESGNLQAMLLQLAEIYEREMDSALGRMKTVLEPALTVVLAVLVCALLWPLAIAVLSIG